jgi:hypothetical protein
VRNSWQQVKSETSVKSLIYVALALHKMEMKMTFYMKEVTHRVKTNIMVQFSGSSDDFLRSMMNKVCNVCQFCSIAILFPSNKLLKLKYIHLFYIFSEKTTVRLMGRFVFWARKWGTSLSLADKGFHQYKERCFKHIIFCNCLPFTRTWAVLFCIVNGK